MSNDDERLTLLLRRLQGAHPPAVALDLRAGTSDYDASLGRRPECIHVELVLAAPSEDDSRYRTEYLGNLRAATADEMASSLALAHVLAGRLGASIHPPGAAPRSYDDKSWVALQGPSPERAWKLAWSATTWNDDGAEVHESGDRTVHACTGRDARVAVEREILSRRAPPCEYKVDLLELRPGYATFCEPPYPSALPPVETLCAWAFEGRRPADLLRVFALEAASSTPRDRMVALAAAFLVELRALAPVSDFCRGALSDDALDAALAPLFERTRDQWSLPLLLRREHAARRSIGPMLREFHDKRSLGVLTLIQATRKAFGLGLGAAKQLVAGTACSGAEDDKLDVMLDAALEAHRGQNGWVDEADAMYAALAAMRARRGA